MKLLLLSSVSILSSERGELALAILQLLEHRFDGAALFGDFADPLAQRLLAAANVLQPFLHVDGFVTPALQRQPRLGLRQLLVNGGQHIFRIAGLKMGDRRVEILLRCGRQYSSLFRARNAALDRAGFPCLTRQAPGLPERRGGQRQRHQSDQDRGDLLGR
jgi:hypothetical protein